MGLTARAKGSGSTVTNMKKFVGPGQMGLTARAMGHCSSMLNIKLEVF
jgi:hypothetical protein